MSAEWCVDDRHGTPCPLPCEVCIDEDCDPAERVTADTPAGAARAAGWSEEYLASMGLTEADPQ